MCTAGDEVSEPKPIILYETSSPVRLAKLSEKNPLQKAKKCQTLKVCGCSLLTEVVHRALSG